MTTLSHLFIQKVSQVKTQKRHIFILQVDPTQPIGYNPLAPKRFNYTVSLYYLKLVEVIEPEEKVSVVLEMAEVGRLNVSTESMLVFQYWYDPRIAWDSSLYGDIKMLHMRQDKVWSPTLSLFRM